MLPLDKSAPTRYVLPEHERKIRAHGDETRKAKRTAARSEVETRYRRHIGEHFEALRNCFEEHELIRDGSSSSSSPTPLSHSVHRRRDSGYCGPRHANKAAVLETAITFIHETSSRIEKRQKRIRALRERLRQAQSILRTAEHGTSAPHVLRDDEQYSQRSKRKQSPAQGENQRVIPTGSHCFDWIT